MPQSLSKVIIHIIFSTKDREAWLDRDVRPRMHAYIATICRDLNAHALLVGGVADHLHIVTTLPRTLSQAAMVETLKKTSSKWMKGLDPKYRGFLLAARLRRILSESQSAKNCSRIRGEPGRAPSHPQFSRGVSRLFVQIRRRIRRTLRLGLKRPQRT
jgi:REP element-mobilizing transposase RayT